MIARPVVGESWWLNDVLLLVLVCDHAKHSVRGLVLLDLDETFNAGTTINWHYDLHQNYMCVELDRRIT